jgi:hypothetical protein
MPQKARRKIYAVQGALAGIMCLSFLLPHDLHMFRADDKEQGMSMQTHTKGKPKSSEQ